MSTQARLRIAARIHYALKHLLGEGIDVAAMLSSPAQAREVLFVCQASGQPELMALAHQYNVACQLAALGKAGARTEAPQDAAWSANTSGFGVTQSAESVLESRHGDLDAAAPRKSWLLKTGWLRRDGAK
ncbi:MAG: hypothetical protein RLZZ618_2807 [Pseudomonadota bacterium]|jgi:hypothetical protein